jgi:hypothetical protein
MRPADMPFPVAQARVVESGARLIAGPLLCGAWARSRQRPCRAPGRGAGSRCPRHGGRSTGPRSPAGKARSLAALAAWRIAAGPAVRSELARRAALARWGRWRAERKESRRG